MWRTKQTNTRQVYACGTSKLLDNSDFTTVNAKRDIVCSIQLKILGSKSLDTSFFPPQINRVAQSLRRISLLLLKRSAALKIHRKTFIINCNFRKATSFRSKAYYPATRDIFAIAALFLLSNNETVFTSCKPIQHEVYLLVSIHWI